MTAPASETLTHVELIWFEKRIEQWIRFGRDVAEQILDRRRRILRAWIKITRRFYNSGS
jgi:hypothetical protein